MYCCNFFFYKLIVDIYNGNNFFKATQLLSTTQMIQAQRKEVIKQNNRQKNMDALN